MTTFEFMSSIPRILKDLNTFMGNTMGARKSWIDWFPAQERLLDGAKEAMPLLVDVGGGKGHDVLDFHSKYPQEGRRLVLQDLASVTDDLVDLGPAVERMTYDFFTDQPVKGNAKPSREPQCVKMIGSLKHHRVASILLPSHTPRLARLVLFEDLGAGQEGNGARLFKAYHPRVDSSRGKV